MEHTIRINLSKQEHQPTMSDVGNGSTVLELEYI